MLTILQNIYEYSQYLPPAIFILLLLAGLNIPISEDLLIISSATIAASQPDMLIPIYIAIYLGVVASDHIAYWLGNMMHNTAKRSKFFTKMFNSKKFAILAKYLKKHGILTFIVCRFIPFGVRNLLFMGCGFTKLKYKSFCLFDTIAATISTSVLYFSIYKLGRAYEKQFKFVGIALFITLIIAVAILTIRLFFFWKEKHGKDDEIPVDLSETESQKEA